MSETPGDNWEVIYRSPMLYRAEMLKDILENEGIQAVVVNKKDSSYIAFGDIEVYIRQSDALNAKLIVDKFDADE